MLPLLAPPIPKFPVQFDSTSTHNQLLNSNITSNDWPTEGETEEIENSELTIKTTIDKTQSDSKWILKTEREEYIATLESKLVKLSKQVVSSHSSKGDSGYGSGIASQGFHPNHNLSGDELYEEGDITEESGGYGEGMDIEEEEITAGEGLLWDNSYQREHEESRISEEVANERSNSREEDESPSQVVIIPATPKASTSNLNYDRLPYRIPSTIPDNIHPSRRISFNSSVRLSGGIRTTTSLQTNHRPTPTLALTQDLFSPTRNTPIHIRSRSASPSSRNQSLSVSASASASSSYRSPSTLQNYPSLTNMRSGPSSIQSRSSSPCSSIYAPLQPPSNTCPSPSFIRTLPPPITKRTITFGEYLRGRQSNTTSSTTEEENLSAEESMRGYRKVLAEQARRKREEKKVFREGQEGLLWWGRIKEMLGNAGAGRRGNSGVGVGVGKATAANNYGTMNNNGIHGDSTNGNIIREDSIDRGRGKTRSSKTINNNNPVRRTASTLSVSSITTLDNEQDEDITEVSSPTIETSNIRVEKTEIDFMFGTAPKRWFKLDWVVWKLHQFIESIKSTLSIYYEYLFRRWNEREVEVEYQRV